MTTAEKLRMYFEKEAFINRLCAAITQPSPKGIAVKNISYEVYKKDNKDSEPWYQEFIVLTYYGDGTCVSGVSGNSNSANFEVIASLINGGDYTWKETYQKVKETWDRVDLSNISSATA